MPGPLTGVRILDLTTVVMGPFATQILAELGADVVKVEAPGGDDMRAPGPMRNPGMGYLFLNLNRGKRSLVLDLKRSEGLRALLRLLPSVDVLVYNLRPAAMARLGLSWDDVREVSPTLLYVGAYGYAERGPYAGKAAYDDLIQGATGIPWLAARREGEPPRYAPVNLADRVTGLHVVYAVTAALFERSRTGRGQAVEVPMFESLTHFVLGEHSAGSTWEPPVGETGYARVLARRPYRTADGWVCVLVYNDKQWANFLEAIDRLDLLADERFATQAGRAARVADIYEFLEGVLATRGTDEWIRLLERFDVPVTPMSSLEDVVADPHLNESGFFALEEHPTEGTLRTMRTPTSWSESEPDAPRPAPRLGEHSAELLGEAGYSESEIEALARSGVTRLG